MTDPTQSTDALCEALLRHTGHVGGITDVAAVALAARARELESERRNLDSARRSAVEECLALRAELTRLRDDIQADLRGLLTSSAALGARVIEEAERRGEERANRPVPRGPHAPGGAAVTSNRKREAEDLADEVRPDSASIEAAREEGRAEERMKLGGIACVACKAERDAALAKLAEVEAAAKAYVDLWGNREYSQKPGTEGDDGSIYDRLVDALSSPTLSLSRLKADVRHAVLEEAAVWCAAQTKTDEYLPPEHFADGLRSLPREPWRWGVSDVAKAPVRLGQGAARACGLAAEGGPVIKELRAKLEAATPGPWAHTRPTEPDVGDEDVRVCYLRDGVHCEWCIALAGESVDGAGERWTKETLDRWHADAALIAAARNALPALLAVVEAALERDGCSEVCSAMKPYRGCTCGAEALSAVLASLTRNDEVDRG